MSDPNNRAQPFISRTGDVVVVFNGEIYNYKEIFDCMYLAGYVPTTQNDGEAIIYLYQVQGIDFVSRLRGMFAIAIFDKARNKIFLVRDRLGEKPLFFSLKHDSFCFSSEARSIVHSGLSFEIDRCSAVSYLLYQYPLEPFSMYKGICKVAAGTVVELDINSWTTKERVFWCMQSQPTKQHGEPNTLLKKELNKVLDLMSVCDRPIGIALSGGLDSSAIAASLAQRRSGLHAFSLGYCETGVQDERAMARELATSLGLNFHPIELAQEDIVNQFPIMIAEMDEPVADISALAYNAIFNEARLYEIPVLFTGHGADELFWGYAWLNEVLAGRPTSRRALFSSHPDNWAALQWCSQFMPRNLNEQIEEQEGSHEAFYDHPLQLKITHFLISTYLKGNGLNQLDTLSMGNSIELRLPYIDYGFVELVLGLIGNHKDLIRGEKFWLREATRGLLPEKLRRRPKLPFVPPYDRWRKTLHDRYGYLLNNGYLVQTGLIDQSARDSLDLLVSPPGVYTSISYKMLCLEIWCRRLSGWGIKDHTRSSRPKLPRPM